MAFQSSKRQTIDRILTQRVFLRFITHMYEGYEVNWHHAHMAKKLDDFISGKIKRLILNLPPQHGKSEMVSRHLPAFIIGKFPDADVILTSYAADLADNFNLNIQRIIEDPKFAALFPGVRLPTKAEILYKRTSAYFEIPNHRGSLRTAGVGTGITGRAGDFIFIDDPIKDAAEANSKLIRDNIWDWYTQSLNSRINKDTRILITMTRWHQDDLVGRLLKLAKDDPTADQWETIIFPAVCQLENNPDDPRKIGEALWPNKHPKESLIKTKALAAGGAWNSMYQQNPTPHKGNLFKRKWFIHRYNRRPFPEDFSNSCMSWDMTFKETSDGSFVVGQAWGQIGSKIHLLDEVRERWEFVDALEAFKNFVLKWPWILAKLVEAKANGPAIMSSLRKDIVGILEVEPDGGKLARAQSVTPFYKAGNVILPEITLAPWVGDHIDEMVAFPKGLFDDRVDASSQALAYFKNPDTYDIASLSKW